MKNLKIRLVCEVTIILLFLFVTKNYSQNSAARLFPTVPTAATVSPKSSSTSTTTTGEKSSKKQPVKVTSSVQSKRKRSTRRKKTAVETPNITIDFEHSDSLSLAENIINYSKLYLGRPYRRGSKGPNSFDCSGFTHFVFNRFGYSLGASSRDQVTEGERLQIDDVRTGDLIFFKGRNSRAERVGHVGIVISNEGNGNLKFIHAACSTGVSIDELKEDYYKRRYITTVRVLKDMGKAVEEKGEVSFLYPEFPQYYLESHTPLILKVSESPSFQ